ncbi:hypothetical protein GS397_00820 [Sphingobium yanoikuyae]|uniref:Uncharacterized protein n=1 Tax=Sphingobium yanoikuyae TaxID=13690 RepID=A0A6P1GC62_SPHYA|nr:hypothetical protein [Sphingobium yanoikuyae]QHD65753.1 hypothetical protein GS397_00820 [Sphingobium yanoikuyae]
MNVTATKPRLNIRFRDAHVNTSGWAEQFVRSALRVMREQAEEDFTPLADALTDATRWASSVSAIKRHPAFTALVAMGKPAAVKIIERLRAGDIRVQWFPILKAITHADPVPADKRGNLPEMAHAWVLWAERRAP